MNLLSKHGPAPSPQEPGSDAPLDEASAAASPEAAHTPAKPPLLMSMASDASVSETIKSALEAALDEELAAEQAHAAERHMPAPKPEPILEAPLPAPEAEPVLEAPLPAPEPEPILEAPAPVPQAAALDPEPQANPTPASSTVDSPNTASAALSRTDTPQSVVNVMDLLVDKNIEKYMKLCGLCQCPRCVIDVKAVALNNLPPVYVVMREGEVSPRLSVYAGRYQTAVTAQLLRACQTVMDNPRHEARGK
jgi:hypothetical protein